MSMKNKCNLDLSRLVDKYPTLNPRKDRGVVIQGLGTDFTKIIESGDIPTGQSPVTYNELPISEVSGRVVDKFDFLGSEIRATGIAISANSGSVGSAGRAVVSSE